LEFNVPFQHKYGYIRDEGKSGPFVTKFGTHVATDNMNKMLQISLLYDYILHESYTTWNVYQSHASVCLSVRRRISTLLQWPGWKLGDGTGAPSCALLGRFAIGARVRCYDNTVRTRNFGECMYLLNAWFLLPSNDFL